MKRRVGFILSTSLHVGSGSGTDTHTWLFSIFFSIGQNKNEKENHGSGSCYGIFLSLFSGSVPRFPCYIHKIIPSIHRSIDPSDPSYTHTHTALPLPHFWLVLPPFLIESFSFTASYMCARNFIYFASFLRPRRY